MGVISDAVPGPVEALKIALASSGVLQVIACLSGNFVCHLFANLPNGSRASKARSSWSNCAKKATPRRRWS